MSKKQLVNDVSLDIGENVSYIDIHLSIPVSIDEADREKLKNKKDIDLGTIRFSENTSNLIKQVGEAIRKELLSKIS